MTVSISTSGSQTAVVNTLHTPVSLLTTAGTYVWKVDTTNMVLLDILELSIFIKLIDTGHTERLAWYAQYQHVQAEPLKVSIPVESPVSLTCKLKQTAGTARVFDWELDVL